MPPNLSKSRRFISAVPQRACVAVWSHAEMRQDKGPEKKQLTGTLRLLDSVLGISGTLAGQTAFRGGPDEALANRIGIGGGCHLLRGIASLSASGGFRLRQ